MNLPTLYDFCSNKTNASVCFGWGFAAIVYKTLCSLFNCQRAESCHIPHPSKIPAAFVALLPTPLHVSVNRTHDHAYDLTLGLRSNYSIFSNRCHLILPHPSKIPTAFAAMVRSSSRACALSTTADHGYSSCDKASGFFNDFFSSVASRRSTFFTSSAGGSDSGRMPRSSKVSRTA